MSDDVEFTVDQKEIDSEFADIQRQVASLQEDLSLKQAQEQAARDEGGPRRSTGGAAAAAGPKNTSAFLAGLDPRVSDNELRLFFSQCGPIRRITILKDRYTGQPRGNAYVEFETEEAVQAAVLKNGQAIHGKPMKIDVKREAPPGSVPPPRGGGPGMGMGGRGAGGGAPGGMMPMMMPMMMPGAAGGPMGGGYAPRGRGGAPQAAAAAAAAAQMQQQMAMAAMMGMMSGAMQFNPYGAQQPGGGRGGRGRGRGRPY